MKKAWAWILLPIWPGLLIFLRRARDPGIFTDTDTAFLLLKLKERGDIWSWFRTDWPLANHFYRPVSTLAFEFDRAVHGTSAAGFGLTQALIAVACVVLATWMVFELSASHAVAGFSGLLFGLWTAGFDTTSVAAPACWLLAVVALGGVARGRRKAASVTLAFLGLAFFAYDPLLLVDLNFRIVGWLPGRTASVMALFCLAAVACYARYERLGAAKVASTATSEDLPATRGTASNRPTGACPLWGIAALVCTGLALASYEQAVMLPAVLTGCAILFRTSGRKSRWWVAAASWGVLLGYFVVRRAVLPVGQSGYQAQQMRYGPGVFNSLSDYFFPGANGLSQIATSLEYFPASYLEARPWVAWILLLGNIAFLVLVWKSRHRWAWAAAWLMSALSFLPMAWVKMFGHYFFWPMAFHAWAVVVGGQVVWSAFVEAVSPPPLKSPPRTEPAPGSL